MTESLIELCDACDGTGTRHATIGGDGYGGKCCGEMDVEGTCDWCDGTGKVLIEDADEDGPLDLEDQLERALDKAFPPQAQRD